MNPFLSIITINLNNREGLKKTIESVISQDFSDYEFILIDGASIDGSVELIKSHENKINYWISEPDSGIYNAMNKGVKKANGFYYLFLNSGDRLVENILQKALPHLCETDLVYFDCLLSKKDGSEEILKYPDQLSMAFFYNSIIGHQATFIKSLLFEKYGFYDETYKIHGDFEFWLRTIIVNNCTYKHIPFALSHYDMHGLSMQKNPFKTLEKERILKKYIPEKISIDYENWFRYKKEMEILEWYNSHSWLNKILVSFYRFVVKLNKILSR